MNLDKDWFCSLGGEKVMPRKDGAVFIAIEGSDGAGKSTQVELLRKHFKNENIASLMTKEPTMNSDAGKRIRRILFGEEDMIDPKELQKLYIEDRREHLEGEIMPALNDGRVVVCDRYFFATFAHAMLDMDDIEELVEHNKSFIMPDIAITILAEPRTCLNRLKEKNKELDFFEKIEKIEKIDGNYRKLADRFDTMLIADGNRTIDEVYRQVLDLVNRVVDKSKFK